MSGHDEITATPSSERSKHTVPTNNLGPLENANVMPGGTRNTAGGNVKEAGYWDALKSIQPAELMTVHQKPCARDSLLVGMGSGVGLGVLQSIRGRKCILAVRKGSRPDNA